MCEKCKDIDNRILHYRQMLSRITDQQTIDALRSLIEDLETEKKARHPDAR